MVAITRGAGARTRIYEKTEEIRKRKRATLDLLDMVPTTCRFRRVFVDGTRYVGFCLQSESLRTKYALYTAAALRTPFFSRLQWSAYQLIDECNVHGLMNGEELDISDSLETRNRPM